MMEQVTKLKGKKILIIGTELWGKLFVSKHHYAKVLALHNEVYYVNPVNLPWTARNILSVPLRLEESGLTNLKVISYANPFPRQNTMPKALQRWAFQKIIEKILSSAGIKSSELIVWNFDLSRFFEMSDWNASFTIAHLVESLKNPYAIRQSPFYKEMIGSSDLVLAVANFICMQLKEIMPGVPVYFINHGADIEAFEMGKRNFIVPGSNGVKAAMVGNFQFSINFELLHRLTETHPNVDFLLIGPHEGSNLGELEPHVVENINLLKRKQNVFFLGQIPSASLMAYLDAIDVNLILYKRIYAEGHGNPHKLMSFFYSGKTILSSFIIEQYKHRSDLVLMEEDEDSFMIRFQDIVNRLKFYNNPQHKEHRKQYAIDNDYKKQVARIDNLITKHEII